MLIKGISIIIPAYNEQAYLPETLCSINIAIKNIKKKIDIPIEVIVVNNASTDQTKEVANQYDARVIDFKKRNISAVRNAGIRESNHELIVAIDADCSLPKESLIKIYDYMSNENTFGAALGVEIVSAKPTTRIFAAAIQFVVGQVSGIHGAMFVFRKSAALAVGGFPEDRLVAEDSAFAISMRKHAREQNKNFGFLKSVKVKTLERKNIQLKDLPKLTHQVVKAFLGAKQTTKDLGFWYKPDR